MKDANIYMSVIQKTIQSKMSLMAKHIEEAGGVVNDYSGKIERIDGLILTDRGEVCPVIKGKWVYGNPINLNTFVGLYHWRTITTGGPEFFWDKNKSLEEACQEFNSVSSSKDFHNIGTFIIASIEIEFN